MHLSPASDTSGFHLAVLDVTVEPPPVAVVLAAGFGGGGAALELVAVLETGGGGGDFAAAGGGGGDGVTVVVVTEPPPELPPPPGLPLPLPPGLPLPLPLGPPLSRVRPGRASAEAARRQSARIAQAACKPTVNGNVSCSVLMTCRRLGVSARMCSSDTRVTGLKATTKEWSQQCRVQCLCVAKAAQ